MKIAVYPADTGGCGYYRLIWPAQALKREGHDVDVLLPDTDGARLNAVMTMENGRERVVDIRDTPEADVVVLQRPLYTHLVDLIEPLQRKGVVVVVEVDDNFDAISPRNSAWVASHPRISRDRNRLNLRRACELADLVTVSTPALAEIYGKHGRVTVIPNYVPERYLSINHDKTEGDVYLGWSGSVATHPDDLQVVRAGVARALKTAGASMAVVGTGVGVHRNLGLHPSVEAKVSGWLDLQTEYADAMAQIDVGIVPLEMSAFNQSKSWLKGIEFASLGVPFVATPTDSYRELHNLGIGHLASNHHDWYHLLVKLLSSKDQAAELGQVYRQRVKDLELTIEAQSSRWLLAWASARRKTRG